MNILSHIWGKRTESPSGKNACPMYYTLYSASFGRCFIKGEGKRE